MIYLRLRSFGMSPVEQAASDNKTRAKRSDMTSRLEERFTDERETTGRAEANQIAGRLGANGDLSLSFMAVLAAHMPPIKTGFLVRWKIRCVRSLRDCVHKLDHARPGTQRVFVDTQICRDERADRLIHFVGYAGDRPLGLSGNGVAPRSVQR